MLSAINFNEKAVEDMAMSKVFSFVASNIQELAMAIKILNSNPLEISSKGYQLFKLDNAQLLGLFHMLKAPNVREQLAKLNKYREEMRKFGQLFQIKI